MDNGTMATATIASLIASALALPASSDAFSVRPGRLPSRVTTHPGPATDGTASTTSFRARGGGGDDDAPPPTSVGDVVRNLHGGKYRFSETQYLAGGSATGREFAESLCAGGGEEEATPDDDDMGELPNWAKKLADFAEQSSKPLLGTLTLEEHNEMHTITIKNDERSWEKFYAFVLPDDGGGAVGFGISPASGTLAPRGGASNACDDTRPYSDEATIAIERRGGADAVAKGEERLLVAGTEAEAWRYRLRVV
ncbi:hypothetical protein ACHAWF_001207 [Thalassiosira exigua]